MIQVGTLIVSVLTFLILYVIVQRFAFKPLAKMLEQRRVHIETQINDAEKSKNVAETLLSEQRRLLDEARREAKVLLDAAQTRSDEHARQIVEAAQTEASRLLEEAREQIVRERTEALNSVLGHVSALTVELTTKLLHGHVTDEVHKDMLKEAEQKLGELVC